MSFSEDGTLLSATLGRTQVISPGAGPLGGRELAAGSLVRFDRDGQIESVDDPSS